MNMQKRGALGKGLSALIEDNRYEVKSVDEAISTGSIAEIDLDKIEVNPHQPRAQFSEESLNELTISIKQLGIIQPITVRKLNNNKFQIISGERRYRASQTAGLTKIPAFIRDVNDNQILELALVENIQREDLNAMEIAITYQRLIDECNLTQEILGDRVGKKRPTITNYLRLLKLPIEIQAGLRDGKLGMGHARALVIMDNQEQMLKVYQRIIDNELSVREAERIIREGDFEENDAQKTNFGNFKPSEKIKLSDDQKSLKKILSKKFEVPVDLKVDASGKGKVVFNCKSSEQFEKIIYLLNNFQLPTP